MSAIVASAAATESHAYFVRDFATQTLWAFVPVKPKVRTINARDHTMFGGPKHRTSVQGKAAHPVDRSNAYHGAA